jgi:hypothetical protein
MACCRSPNPAASTAPHQHRLAVGIDLGTTNSLVATVRNGVPVVLPDEARPRCCCRRWCTTAPTDRAVGARGRAPRRTDPRNTIASVKRFMGRGLADVARREAAVCPTTSSLSDRHGGMRTRAGREEPGGGVGRDPAVLRSAPRTAGRRAGRRGDHRAGLLRRRPAPGHQGRRPAGRPERAAPAQRAHRRGGGLRPGQRQSEGSTRSTTWAAAPSTSRCCA